MTREIDFVVQSHQVEGNKQEIYCIGLPKPAKQEPGKGTGTGKGKGKGKGTASKKKDTPYKVWQATLRKWAPERAEAVVELAGTALRRAVESGAFDGSKGSTLFLPAGDEAWVFVIGLGDEDRVDAKTVYRAAALAARKADSMKDHVLVSLLHEAPVAGLDEGDRVEATVQGFVAGTYRFDRYSSNEGSGSGQQKGSAKRTSKQGDGGKLEVGILVADARASRRVRPRVDAARVAAEAQLVARDLANTPGNEATPEYLAKEARRIAREVGLSCKVMGVPELKQRKMNGILAVGQGSSNPPRLIVLKHSPSRNRARTFRRVVVVGKGITFDTGGISIKPSDRMELMKYDKSGACAVIGLMVAVARAALPVEVVALAACAENMPSGTAYRPGDIVTMANGKTVEVLNTDAEGRMVLADALDYAGSFKPDAVIDVATLTGAIDVALGSHYSGLMGTDDELVRLLEQAGEKTGERVWRMPIGPEYQEQIKGSHSDLVNVGGRSGGALTAGQFLSNFAPEGVAWAHLDIAGTAWDDKDRPENRKGATGVGVRLLHRFLSELV